MKKIILTCVTCLSFSFFSVNLALASQVVNSSPIIVQPYDLGDINQQMLTQDRINRDQELAIRGLVEDNQKLTNTALARKQNASLDKIYDTMAKYRNYLVARDQARIMANNFNASKYHDLIKLTQDIDDSKAVGQTLELKRNVIEEKYKILTDLKNEMIALNEKLKKRDIPQKEDSGPKVDAGKLQELTQRLAQMDQKVVQYDQIIAQKDKQITQLNSQVGLLKTELESKILVNSKQGLNDELIKKKQDQIDLLKSELGKKIADNSNQEQKDKIIKEKNDQLELLKAELEKKIAEGKNLDQLKALVPQQAIDLKSKTETIHWLNEVLAATKNKAKYYQLTSQQNQLTIQQIQQEVQGIKNDFSRRYKDYSQLEGNVNSLKGQVASLSAQLSQKRAQVDTLRNELENKINQEKKQGQATNDRLKLAGQLIQLQNQEAYLLDTKSKLMLEQNNIIDNHFGSFEHRMKVLISDRQIQDVDLNEQMDALKQELALKQQDVELLKGQLDEKIAHEKNQDQLLNQIQDLKKKLHDKEGQILTMKAEIRAGHQSEIQAEDFKQQLAQEQNKADELKKELEAKNAQLEKTNALMADYQKKLEAKNSAYNKQLAEVLVSRQDQTQMQAQEANLMAQLQQKEAQIVKIKKQMEDLQQLAKAKDADLQARDLSLSLVTQKSVDHDSEVKNLKTQLALTRAALDGMPSSDEIDFLKTGYKKATSQLKQRDDALFQIKANADEYAKEFKEQTKEFQSLKEQLQEANEEIKKKNVDLKYKNFELARLKERSRLKEALLQNQIKALTQKLKSTDKNMPKGASGNKAEVLEGKLKSDHARITELQAQLDQLKTLSKGDTTTEKLKQALDKIDQQGKVINLLAQKLQDAGQSVDLTRNADK